jgi:hypothetical protein
MSSRARAVLFSLAVVVLFALPLLPEILGKRRLVFRDAQITHWPWRRVAMESWREGRVPFVNASASGGQPFLANPNAVLLYPTVLLETVLPAASAFNLHYLIHILWAFFGARALASRLRLSPGPAFVAGTAYAFSGMMLSYGSAFFNSGAAASWLPWCAAAVLDLARARQLRAVLRSAGATAIAFGLQFLAGEPAISLLTSLFAAALAASEVLGVAGERARRCLLFLGGALGSGIAAAALAAPLLWPLAAIAGFTYRGQHLYSERAFGASPLAAWRMIEWLFPRFSGDPGALGAGGHWQYALHGGDVVYIWCVSLGVVPLLLVAAAALSRDFWDRRTCWLTAVGSVAFFFSLGSALPFYRVLFSLAFLRRFRYPIKFYLLTTICVALLAGLAAESWKRRKAGRREAVLLAAVALLFAAAFFVAHAGGPFDRGVAPLLSSLKAPAAVLLPAIRASLRGDALFGLAATAVVALAIAPRRRAPGEGHLLGLAILLLALPWGLPLFVSADEKTLARAPALLPALSGPGRVYISPALPEFNVLLSGTSHPALPKRVPEFARIQIEELIPATGSPFGVRYLFDGDPDGSYGYCNRIASEVLTASTPPQAARLLRTFGARWALEDEGERLPSFRPVTGFVIAGRRLVLSEIPQAVPEVRWAGREHRRISLSGALEFVRSETFQPETDIVLPGRVDRDALAGATGAAFSIESATPDSAAVLVDTAAAGHVIFSRTFFPAWKARVDGALTPVQVANGRDLAVAVPPGAHRIEFEYDRTPFVRGAIVQAAAFLSICIAVRRRRRSGTIDA